MLEKVASVSLKKVAPHVYDVYSRFSITSDAQEEMMLAVSSNGLSALQAACAWMKNHEEEINKWLPARAFLAPF